MKKRVEKLKEQFNKYNIDAFLVTHLPGIRYLSGFSGSNGICLIQENTRFFFTDPRYKEQSKLEVSDFEIILTERDLIREAKRACYLSPKLRVGFDAKYLTIDDYSLLRKSIPQKNLVLTNLCIDSIRAVKDTNEIEEISHAAEITDNIFTELLHIIKPGIAELDISAEISYRIKKAGASSDAFDPIVAFGDHAAITHAEPGMKKLKKGEGIIIDFGCVWNGYRSDITRTVFLGNPSGIMKKIYNVVHSAQQEALGSVRAGIIARELDAVARRYITAHRFGKYFSHSLGHGLGLEVHEMPRITRTNSDPLAAGNVITIEPGIYIPGIGGVRIEDDVAVEEEGAKILTNAPKEMICL